MPQQSRLDEHAARRPPTLVFYVLFTADVTQLLESLLSFGEKPGSLGGGEGGDDGEDSRGQGSVPGPLHRPSVRAQDDVVLVEVQEDEGGAVADIWNKKNKTRLVIRSILKRSY